MKKIIIDCDPGHDDAVAILLALAQKDVLEVAAITTVCGNNTLENMTKNAQLIATVTGEKPLIAQGADKPFISEPIISSEFHGVSGMDGHTNTPPINAPVSDQSALETMKQILENSDTKVTIVGLGPLTNLAILIKAYPHLKQNIEQISLMGGSLYGGNITKTAEFNIYVDPEAAHIVFNSGIPILMSGIELTEQVQIYPEEYAQLRTKSEPGRFFSELMDFYILKTEAFGTTGCVMHDPCAIACLIQPELFKGIRGHVDIGLTDENRGKTTLTPSEAGTTIAYTEVEDKKVVTMILDAIASYK